MIYYLTYILIALTAILVIYFKPGFIKMAARNMAMGEITVGKRILGYATIIFCVLISIYMMVLLAAGVFGIYIVLTA